MCSLTSGGTPSRLALKGLLLFFGEDAMVRCEVVLMKKIRERNAGRNTVGARAVPALEQDVTRAFLTSCRLPEQLQLHRTLRNVTD